MNNRLIAAVGIVCALGVGVLVLRSPEEGTQTAVQAMSTQAAQEQEGSGTSSPATGIRRTVGQPVSVVTRPPDIPLEQLFDAYACDNQRNCDNSISGAASEMEALWLYKHGYPTPEQEELFVGMPTEELESAARRGNLAAKAALGERLLDAGRTEEGLNELFNASTHGSVYAVYKTAEAYATQSSVQDRDKSLAYYRLAAQMGDWKATRKLYAEFPQVSALEMAIAEKSAATIHRNLLDYLAKKRHLVLFSPRPTE